MPFLWSNPTPSDDTMAKIASQPMVQAQNIGNIVASILSDRRAKEEQRQQQINQAISTAKQAYGQYQQNQSQGQLADYMQNSQYGQTNYNADQANAAMSSASPDARIAMMEWDLKQRKAAQEQQQLNQPPVYAQGPYPDQTLVKTGNKYDIVTDPRLKTEQTDPNIEYNRSIEVDKEQRRRELEALKAQTGLDLSAVSPTSAAYIKRDTGEKVSADDPELRKNPSKYDAVMVDKDGLPVKIPVDVWEKSVGTYRGIQERPLPERPQRQPDTRQPRGGATGMVHVVGPNGESGNIPTSELQDYLKAGWFQQ